MRKSIAILTIVLLVLFMVGCENSANPTQPQTQNDNQGISLAKGGGKPSNGCGTITAGELVYPEGEYLEGEIIPLGFDAYGCNYQGHIFKGSYINAWLGRYGYPPYNGDDNAYIQANPDIVDWSRWKYRDLDVIIKWNDAYKSNSDCDGDGTWERHYGFDTYQGSGAWITYHVNGTYYWEDEECEVTEFVKMIAVPEDAYYEDNGEDYIWYHENGDEIGIAYGSYFAIIQQKNTDPCGGWGGTNFYKSPDHSGLGGW